MGFNKLEAIQYELHELVREARLFSCHGVEQSGIRLMRPTFSVSVIVMALVIPSQK